MNKFNKIKEAIVGFFKKLSKKQLIAIISAVVAVAILVSVIILISNGNGDNPKKPPVTNQGTPPSGNNVEVTTPDPNAPVMPEKVDMGGYTYRAYVRSNESQSDPVENGNYAFYCEDFWIDTTGGEPEDALAYAVYRRNKEIDNDYNVKIRQVNQTANTNMAKELAMFYQNQGRYDLTIILAKFS